MDLNISKTVELLRQAVTSLEEANASSDTARMPAANDPAADSDIRRLLNSTSFNSNIPSTSSNGNRPSTSSSSNRPSTSTTRPTGTSTSSEIRRLFTPYNRSNPSRRISTHQRLSKWSHKFLCLADPQQDYVPNKDMKVNLSMAGLGEKRLVLNKSINPAYFMECVLDNFPKLKEGGGFELLRTCNRTCLEVIPPQRSGYTSSFLADSCSLGQSVIFIRPLQQALNLDISADESEPTDDCPIEKCLICEKDIPIIQLKSHIKEEHEGDDALPFIKKKMKIRSICDYTCHKEDLESELHKNDTPKCEVQCPICKAYFDSDIIEVHSASCGEKADTVIQEVSCIILSTLKEELLKIVKNRQDDKSDNILRFDVVRSKFIETAMDQLQESDVKDFERPKVSVEFIGEEGVDYLKMVY